MSAALYGLTHRGTPGDVAFYRALCRGARSVLELGSGDGRLLSALASARRRVVGLEREPRFIARARRRIRALPPPRRDSVRLIRADMREFELAGRFERVLLPYNALYCLLDQRAALDCFRCVRAALEPSGLFALDVWNATPFAKRVSAAGGQAKQPIASLHHAGRTWDVFEQLRVWRARQRLLATYRYVPRQGGAAEVQMAIPQRYYLAAELGRLLTRAGFQIVTRFGDFDGSPYTSRSPQLVVLARPR